MVVFGQKWLYSGRSGCIPAIWFYSGKVVVFGQNGCIWARVVVIGQQLLYIKVVVFGQIGCIR